MSSEKLIQYYHAPSEEFLNSSLYVTWAGHRQCTPDFSEGPKMIDSYIMLFVLEGKGYAEFNNGESKKLTKGDFLIYYPKQRHYFYANENDPMEIMWIYFQGTHCQAMLDNMGLKKSEPLHHLFISHSIQRTLNTIINALGMNDDPQRLAATGETMILFSYIKNTLEGRNRLKENYKQDTAIARVISFIEENYHMDINIDILCNHVNYSRSYLSRLFKKEVNMTIPEYANTIRIQHAKILLSESTMSMREVASSVGFSDPYYFSNVFKSFTGCSPSTYRSNNKKI